MADARGLRPSPTARLRFRELVQGDLDELAALLGDPEAMAYYPEPKTREQTADWIERTAVSQREHGHTLWAIEGHDGEFLGDCGITWQSYNGIAVREIGYHLVRARQGQGLATEAARSCLELARREFPGETLTAIIHPDNVASRRVAEKLGMIHIADDHAHPWITRTVMGLVLPSR